jgi:hypothetical protein
MMHSRRVLTLGLSGVAGACGGGAAARADVPVYALRLQSGLAKPLFVTAPPGDGGNANDTDPAGATMVGHTPNMGNAQDLTSLLGKMLRVDPSADDFPADATKNYAIPKGGAGQPAKNPFYSNPSYPSARAESWNYGLRNPWRNSFDRRTGDLPVEASAVPEPTAVSGLLAALMVRRRRAPTPPS